MEQRVDGWDDRIDHLRKKRELEAVPKYGEINPPNDPRNFLTELTDEILDALNYLEWAMLKGQISLCEWILADKDLKFVLYRLHRAKN